MSFESFQFVDEEIQNLISAEPTGNSFTALLELPPNQAVKLLHSSEEPTPVFSAMEVEISPETMSSIPPNSSPNYWNAVKQEPTEPGYLYNSSPVFLDPVISKSTKRKEREEKQVKSSAKKMKSVTKETDGEKLPYIHVRARRGEATDSHSLAERARREKINARMKLLQELVPGCNKGDDPPPPTITTATHLLHLAAPPRASLSLSIIFVFVSLSLSNPPPPSLSPPSLSTLPPLLITFPLSETITTPIIFPSSETITVTYHLALVGDHHRYLPSPPISLFRSPLLSALQI